MDEMRIGATCTDILGFEFNFKRTVSVFQSLYDGRLFDVANTVRSFVWDLSRADTSLDEKQFTIAYTRRSQHALKTWFQFNWLGQISTANKSFNEIYKLALSNNPYLDILIYDNPVRTDNNSIERRLLTWNEACDAYLNICNFDEPGLFMDHKGNKITFHSVMAAIVDLIQVIGEDAQFMVSERHESYNVLIVPVGDGAAEVKINLWKPLVWNKNARWEA